MGLGLMHRFLMHHLELTTTWNLRCLLRNRLHAVYYIHQI